MLHRGRALVEQGQGEEGIGQIRMGLARWLTVLGEVSHSYHLAVLADAYRREGRIEESAGAITEALAVVQQTGERYYEAELYRLQGELTLEQSQDWKEAETCFHQAIAIAQKQSAKSWELRAATSLARQGKRVEAHDLLAPVYNWFTEGFETADLKEAQVLLEQLS